MTQTTPCERDERDLERRYIDLLGRSAPRIARIARAWTHSSADEEELRSEIHLQVWRALPRFEGRSAEETWLYRVALNTAMGFARARRRMPDRVVTPREMPEPSVPASAPTRIDGRATLMRVRQALRELDDLDRALVALWLEEMPYREIGEVVGLSESNVGVRLHRARKRLAHRLSPLGEEEARR